MTTGATADVARMESLKSREGVGIGLRSIEVHAAEEATELLNAFARVDAEGLTLVRVEVLQASMSATLG